jgi:hypothetical protein
MCGGSSFVEWAPGDGDPVVEEQRLADDGPAQNHLPEAEGFRQWRRYKSNNRAFTKIPKIHSFPWVWVGGVYLVVSSTPATRGDWSYGS